MKNVTGILTTIIFILIVSAPLFSQEVGDFGSLGSGNWGTTGANWLVCATAGTWTDATPAAAAPAATNNVWIRSGHTVIVEASPKTCKNLTVESGALIYCGIKQPTGTIRYIRVSGSTVTNNGTIGFPVNDSSDVISFELNASVTFQGTGVTKICRIRPQSTASGITITFDQNVLLTYMGSSGTGGAGLYTANSATNDNITIIVNAGKTLTCAPKCNINTASSTDSDGTANTTFTINGTIYQDTSGNVGLGVAAGKTCNVTVNGSWTIGGKISALATSAGTINITIGAGAMFKVAALGSSTCDISKATTIIDGTFDFGISSTTTRSLGTATVNSGGKLRFQNGSFPTGTVTMNPGAVVELYGANPFTFGNTPASIQNLMMSNSSQVTLGSNLDITGALTLQGGTFATGANVLSLATGAILTRTSGYIWGNFKKPVATGAANVIFEIGDTLNYTPVTVAFGNVTTAGNLTALSVAGQHPNLGTANVDTIKKLNRYYTLTNSGTAFDNAAATFNFAAGDVAPGANPSNFKVKRYENSAWSSATTANPLATSIQATGLTAFGDFAMAQDPPLPGLALSAAAIEFGNVFNGSSKADSIKVTNTGTGALTIDSVVTTSSVFTVAPAGAVTLQPNEVKKYDITFSPLTAGAANGKLVFYHNAPTLRDTANLSGTGVTLPAVITSNGTGGGDWALPATWTGGVVPAQVDTVVILGTDSVFTSAAISCAAVKVKNGAKVNLSAAAATLSAGAITLEANTKFFNNSTSPTLAGTAAVYSIDSLSTVYHLGSGTVGGGTNLTFGTLVLRRGTSGTTAGGNLLILKDLSLENTSTGATFRGANASAGDRTHLVKGNVYVYGGTLSGIDVGVAGQTNIWNINGDVLVTGSNSRIGPFTSASATGTSIFNINGNLTVTGARLQAGSSSTMGNGTGIFNLKGNFTVGAGSSVATNSTGPIAFNFLGSATQTVALGINFQMSTNICDTISSGATVVFDIDTAKFQSSTGGSFVVNGTLEMKGVSKLTGAASFALNPGATLKTGNPAGISVDSTGSILVTGTRTFSPEAIYWYSGTAAQVTGNGMPASVSGLIITNPAGVTLTNDVTSNSTRVLGGDLELNGKTFTVSPTGVLSESPGNTVKGLTGKVITTRDIGAPTSMNVGGLGAIITSAQNLGLTTIERYHSAASGNGNLGILRYYKVAPANNTGLNATLKFRYDESEIGGMPENRLKLFYSQTGANNTWMDMGGVVDTADNSITLTGITNFAYWTAADNQSPIPVELTSFRADVKNNNVSLQWKTASETQNKGWFIERRETAKEWTVGGFVSGAGTSSEKHEYTWTDKALNNSTYEYRLKQVDYDGTHSYSNSIEVEVNAIPVEFALHQNYPNPFNPETMIRFDLPENALVNISVYNAIGQKVADLINAQMEKGAHKVSFDASRLPSGLYFYRMTAGSFVVTKKMNVIK